MLRVIPHLLSCSSLVGAERYGMPLELCVQHDFSTCPQLSGCSSQPCEVLRSYEHALPCYALSRRLSKILRPFVETSERILESTNDLVETMEEVTLNEDERLVSYDVKSLFTSISVEESIVYGNES